MSSKIKVVFIIITAIILVFAWSPWINNQNIHTRFLREKGYNDGTVGKDGKLVCDYTVTWVPFGKFVASCEAGYYVPFWEAR